MYEYVHSTTYARCYEDAVGKNKDERDAIQKKTFTKWVNKHLKKVGKKVNHIYEDLRDGENLLSLLEVLSKSNLPREKGCLRFHMLQNVQIALDCLKCRSIKLVNIRSEDIVDGNQKLTLGLIWTIILHFQISDIVANGQNQDAGSAKEALLNWVQSTLIPYSRIRVKDFTESWKDGMAFNYILHRFKPDQVDIKALLRLAPMDRLKHAFDAAQKDFGVTKLLDPEDVDIEKPDERSIITYVSSIYDAMPETPAFSNAHLDNELKLKISDYEKRVSSFVLWLNNAENFMTKYDVSLTPECVQEAINGLEWFVKRERSPREFEKSDLYATYEELQEFAATFCDKHKWETIFSKATNPLDIEKTWDNLSILEEKKRQNLRYLFEKAKNPTPSQIVISNQSSHDRQIRIELKTSKSENNKAIVDSSNEIYALPFYKDYQNFLGQFREALRDRTIWLENLIKNLDIVELEDIVVNFNKEDTHLSKLLTQLERIEEIKVKLCDKMNSHTNASKHQAIIHQEYLDQKNVYTNLELRYDETRRNLNDLQDFVNLSMTLLSWLNQRVEVEIRRDWASLRFDMDATQRYHKQLCVDMIEKKLDLDRCIDVGNALYNLGYSSSQIKCLINSLQTQWVWLNQLVNCFDVHFETKQKHNEINAEVIEIEKTIYETLRSIKTSSSQQYFKTETPSPISFAETQTPHVNGHSKPNNSTNSDSNLLSASDNMMIGNNNVANNLNRDFSSDSSLNDCKNHQNGYGPKNGTFSYDLEGDNRLKLIKSCGDVLEDCHDKLLRLRQQAQILPSINARKFKTKEPRKLKALCDYKSTKDQILNGSEYWLVDNQNITFWKIVGCITNREHACPSVCFIIQPPSEDLLSCIENLLSILKRSFENWKICYANVQYQTIMTNIISINRWDSEDIHDDIKKSVLVKMKNLINDLMSKQEKGTIMDANDIEIMKEEISACYVLNLALISENVDEIVVDVGRKEDEILSQITKLEVVFDDYHRKLVERHNKVVTLNHDDLETLVIVHKEYEENLQNLEPQIEGLKMKIDSLSNFQKTSKIMGSLDELLKFWDYLWNKSHLYVEKLKCIEIISNNAEEASHVLSKAEISLANMGAMFNPIYSSSTTHLNFSKDTLIFSTSIRNGLRDLESLTSYVDAQQAVMDTLDNHLKTLTNVYKENNEILPQNETKYTLGNKQEADQDVTDINTAALVAIKKCVDGILGRWEEVASQIFLRKQTLTQSEASLSKYGTLIEREIKVLDNIEYRLNAEQESNSDSHKRDLDILNRLNAEKPYLEDLNVEASHLAKLTESFDLVTLDYFSLLQEVHPSIEASINSVSRKRYRTFTNINIDTSAPSDDNKAISSNGNSAQPSRNIVKDKESEKRLNNLAEELLDQTDQINKSYLKCLDIVKQKIQERNDRLRDENLNYYLEKCNEIDKAIESMNAIKSSLENQNKLKSLEDLKLEIQKSKFFKSDVMELNKKIADMEAKIQKDYNLKEGDDLINSTDTPSSLFELQAKLESLKTRLGDLHTFYANQMLTDNQTDLYSPNLSNQEVQAFETWLNHINAKLDKSPDFSEIAELRAYIIDSKQSIANKEIELGQKGPLGAAILQSQDWLALKTKVDDKLSEHQIRAARLEQYETRKASVLNWIKDKRADGIECAEPTRALKECISLSELCSDGRSADALDKIENTRLKSLKNGYTEFHRNYQLENFSIFSEELKELYPDLSSTIEGEIKSIETDLQNLQKGYSDKINALETLINDMNEYEILAKDSENVVTKCETKLDCIMSNIESNDGETNNTEDLTPEFKKIEKELDIGNRQILKAEKICDDMADKCLRCFLHDKYDPTMKDEAKIVSANFKGLLKDTKLKYDISSKNLVSGMSLIADMDKISNKIRQHTKQISKELSQVEEDILSPSETIMSPTKLREIDEKISQLKIYKSKLSNISAFIEDLESFVKKSPLSSNTMHEKNISDLRNHRDKCFALADNRLSRAQICARVFEDFNDQFQRLEIDLEDIINDKNGTLSEINETLLKRRSCQNDQLPLIIKQYQDYKSQTILPLQSHVTEFLSNYRDIKNLSQFLDSIPPKDLEILTPHVDASLTSLICEKLKHDLNVLKDKNHSLADKIMYTDEHIQDALKNDGKMSQILNKCRAGLQKLKDRLESDTGFREANLDKKERIEFGGLPTWDDCTDSKLDNKDVRLKYSNLLRCLNDEMKNDLKDIQDIDQNLDHLMLESADVKELKESAHINNMAVLKLREFKEECLLFKEKLKFAASIYQKALKFCNASNQDFEKLNTWFDKTEIALITVGNFKPNYIKELMEERQNTIVTTVMPTFLESNYSLLPLLGDTDSPCDKNLRSSCSHFREHCETLGNELEQKHDKALQGHDNMAKLEEISRSLNHWLRTSVEPKLELYGYQLSPLLEPLKSQYNKLKSLKALFIEKRVSLNEMNTISKNLDRSVIDKTIMLEHHGEWAKIGDKFERLNQTCIHLLDKVETENLPAAKNFQDNREELNRYLTVLEKELESGELAALSINSQLEKLLQHEIECQEKVSLADDLRSYLEEHTNNQPISDDSKSRLNDPTDLNSSPNPGDSLQTPVPYLCEMTQLLKTLVDQDLSRFRSAKSNLETRREKLSLITRQLKALSVNVEETRVWMRDAAAYLSLVDPEEINNSNESSKSGRSSVISDQKVETHRTALYMLDPDALLTRLENLKLLESDIQGQNARIKNLNVEINRTVREAYPFISKQMSSFASSSNNSLKKPDRQNESKEMEGENDSELAIEKKASNNLIDEITANYDRLKRLSNKVSRKCGQKISLFRRLLPSLQNFVADYDSFVTWLDEAENECESLLQEDGDTTIKDFEEIKKLIKTADDNESRLDKITQNSDQIISVSKSIFLSAAPLLDYSSDSDSEIDNKTADIKNLEMEPNPVQQHLTELMTDLKRRYLAVKDHLGALNLSPNNERSVFASQLNQSFPDFTLPDSGAFENPNAMSVSQREYNEADLNGDIALTSRKLEAFLMGIAETADRLARAEPISCFPDKIKGQILDNSRLAEVLGQRVALYSSVKERAEQFLTQDSSLNAGDTPEMQDKRNEIEEKLDKLNQLWNAVMTTMETRGKALEDTLELSNKFWEELFALFAALKEIQENLKFLEIPATIPETLQEQQDEIQALKDELECVVGPEIEQCKRTGSDLMELIDQDCPDRPELSRSVHELDSAFSTTVRSLVDRERNLGKAMSRCFAFYDALNEFAGFLDQAEADLQIIVDTKPNSPSAEDSINDTNLSSKSELEALRQADHALKVLKSQIDPKALDFQRLNTLGRDMIATPSYDNNQYNETDHSPEDDNKIAQLLNKVNNRWEMLCQNVSDRQIALENSLVELGHLTGAVTEMNTWLEHAETAIRDFPEMLESLDVKALEILMAKHKVLRTDTAHKRQTLDSLNSALALAQSSRLAASFPSLSLTSLNSPSTLLNSSIQSNNHYMMNQEISRLNERWRLCRDELESQNSALEGALRDRQGLLAEVRDCLDWLERLDSRYLCPTSSSNSSNLNNHDLTTIYYGLDGGPNNRLTFGANESGMECNNVMRDVRDMCGAGPLGGLPQTVGEQIDAFKGRVIKELESGESHYRSLLSRGETVLKQKEKCSIVAENTEAFSNGASLEKYLDALKTKWDAVQVRVRDRKTKLEVALKQAQEFEDYLKECHSNMATLESLLDRYREDGIPKTLDRISVTSTEFNENYLKPAETYKTQDMIKLDKLGTRLMYFCLKQDCVVIKNCLINARHRWDKVHSSGIELKRKLERGKKDATDFYSCHGKVEEGLKGLEGRINGIFSGNSLDVEQKNEENEATTHYDKTKTMLGQLKVLRTELSTLQPDYELVLRKGKDLVEDCNDQTSPPSLKCDYNVIQSMITNLKQSWIAISERSAHHQRSLEADLILRGEIRAVCAELKEWSLRETARLESEIGCLYGDCETVNGLMENHRLFLNESEARSANVDALRASIASSNSSSENSSKNLLETQNLNELTNLWQTLNSRASDTTATLAKSKEMAEQFESNVRCLVDWMDGEGRKDIEKIANGIGGSPTETGHLLAASDLGLKILTSKSDACQAYRNELSRREPVYHKIQELSRQILSSANPKAHRSIQNWTSLVEQMWTDLSSKRDMLQERLAQMLEETKFRAKLLDELLIWLTTAEATLTAADQRPLPTDIESVEAFLKEHKEFMEDMNNKQQDIQKLTVNQSMLPILANDTSKFKRSKYAPYKKSQTDLTTENSTLSPHKQQAQNGASTANPEYKNIKIRNLFHKWRCVWLLSIDRQTKLTDHLNYLKEVDRLKDFQFEEWKKRYMNWMNHKKSRIMDFFRRNDKDGDGRMTLAEFIDGICSTNFPTTRPEMERVAKVIDTNSDGYIDYKEYMKALRPSSTSGQTINPVTEVEKVKDEVKRQANLCECVRKYKVDHIGEGKYIFGDSQKLRLVRILRSTVMVRVGGGWVALEEFLVKNDPCRAKGRTNIELREPFILASGVSQAMASFKAKSPHSSPLSPASFLSSLGFNTPGPITKIREKTPRSTPWRINSSNNNYGSSGNKTASSTPSSSQSPVPPHQQYPASNQFFSPSPFSGIAKKGIGSSNNSKSSTRSNSRVSSRLPSRAQSPVIFSNLIEKRGEVEPENYIETSASTNSKTLAGTTLTTVTFKTKVSKVKTIVGSANSCNATPKKFVKK
ncbi:unnamed protein product [Gordionus sp. m RMFG-2023]|uniref:microtubule-actin cross-linking factor 1, isoforms 1/2/3/4/5-like isoform X2 n=1 Tax=Gordionus sp. m RMFG-2023 TaxID=3053472 RepID=UPI0030DDE37C